LLQKHLRSVVLHFYWMKGNRSVEGSSTVIIRKSRTYENVDDSCAAILAGSRDVVGVKTSLSDLKGVGDSTLDGGNKGELGGN
jgi:hypothetical protein